MATERDYVLGTHDEEIARLGLQHRAWRPRASDAWKRAGFTAGQTLLDIGCGPGFAAVDLAEIVGTSGRVVAMDRSRRFLDVLDATARSRGLAQLEVREMDLDEQPLPEIGAHGAWSRWVFAFVRHPRRLLEQTKKALRPGGVFVSHEYVDYRTWRLSPRREAFELFVSLVMDSWRENGGEPDIAMDLPRWLEELGFEVLERRPIVEAPKPGDFLWQWPRAFVDTGISRLVAIGRMTEAQARAAHDAFAEVEADPHGFCVLPTVLETIAVRR